MNVETLFRIAPTPVCWYLTEVIYKNMLEIFRIAQNLYFQVGTYTVRGNQHGSEKYLHGISICKVRILPSKFMYVSNYGLL